MEIAADATHEVVTRLRRVEGQIGGIIRMLEERRECADIVTQVAAAGHALNRAGFKLLASGMRQCMVDGPDGSNGGMTIDAMEKLFLSLA